MGGTALQGGILVVELLWVGMWRVGGWRKSEGGSAELWHAGQSTEAGLGGARHSRERVHFFVSLYRPCHTGELEPHNAKHKLPEAHTQATRSPSATFLSVGE